MDCSQSEELLVSYLLGTLDSHEREAVSVHIDACPVCSAKLEDDGEIVTELAISVPKLEVPSRVKQGLMVRIDADLAAQKPTAPSGKLRKLQSFANRIFTTQPAKAVASVLVFGLIFSGIWFNVRLNQISKENESITGKLEAVSRHSEDLAGQIREMATRESQVIDMVKTQRYQTYEALRMSAAPGTSIKILKGTREVSEEARGMMLTSRSGTEALLLAINLPPLPSDKVYQIWLIKGNQRINGGLFTVDSTGYGQTVIILYRSLAEFDGIGITIEPVGGSLGPTGTSVLKGDL